MTFQEVYLMDNLTIEAKAIYGMLCSFAGSETAEAFPSVDFICRTLQISRTRFYKHMNLLVGAGVVERKTEKAENGAFKSNIYTLVPNLQNIHYPYTGNEYTGNGYTGNGYTGNEYTNSNNINSNNINNNNLNTDVSPEPVKQPPDTSGIELPLIDKTAYNVPLSKITIWEAAYPSVNIRGELRKMIAWLDSNPTRRKTRKGVERFINTWLSREQDKGRGRQQSQEPEPKQMSEEEINRLYELWKHPEPEERDPDKPFG